MTILRATQAHLEPLTALAVALWPEHTIEALRPSMAEAVAGENSACFLAFRGDTAVGFAQCQLRHDYVEGTETSPVGYLEGVFVEPFCRRQGIAARLLSACRDWAREKGCREFASDCELTNRESYHFHLKMGFCEANRIICFTQTL